MDSISDKTTWSEQFLDFLVFSGHHRSLSDPADNFVVPIDYGVDVGDPDPKYRNRTGSLIILAQELDRVSFRVK